MKGLLNWEWGRGSLFRSLSAKGARPQMGSWVTASWMTSWMTFLRLVRSRIIFRPA